MKRVTENYSSDPTTCMLECKVAQLYDKISFYKSHRNPKYKELCKKAQDELEKYLKRLGC